MVIDIWAQLGHALRTQMLKQLDQFARVYLPKSDRHVLKQVSIPLLTLPQRLFRFLASGDIHHCAYELELAWHIDQRMGDHIKMLD